MLPNPAVVGFRKGPTARLASVGCIARPSLIQELNPRTPTLRLHPSRPRANQPILAQAISGSSSGDDGSAGQQPSGAGPIAGLNPNILDKQKFRRLLKAKVSYIKVFFRSQKVSVVFQYMLFVASLMFVGLYVTSTYIPVLRGSLRWKMELGLCCFFAAEYTYRLIISHPTWGSKLRMVTSLRNVLDLFAFAPPLIEAALQHFAPTFTLGVDLRWVKLLRSIRVLRIGLLGAELHSLHLSTTKGGWLSAGANFRLFQLATSVFMLLFMTTSVIQIVEQIPFHKAMYFVATTLTTVGYGDVVPKTFLGRACVLAMIAVGVVLIPVQAAQFYSEVTARRVIRGVLPDWKSKPFVLLSTRLTEVRAFSDLYSEFQQALGHAVMFPRNTALTVLCNRPSYEFTAFQELHERSVTLVEGSAVSGQDLVTVHAERAKAIMLLADRFTTDPDQEDLSILFQVWACKSFTKTVPLYVQTIRQSTVRQIAPFLDPGQDVIVSMEQTRFRLLALSAVCPGASTLIGNILKSSSVRRLKMREPTLAGRRWLRGYVNGCDSRFCEVPVLKHLAGQPFIEVAEWLYWASGFVLIGVIDDEEEVRLNPARERLTMGTTLLVIGHSKKAVIRAMKAQYYPISERLREKLRQKTALMAANKGNKAGVSSSSNVGSKAPVSNHMNGTMDSLEYAEEQRGVAGMRTSASGRLRWEEKLSPCTDSYDSPYYEGEDGEALSIPGHTNNVISSTASIGTALVGTESSQASIDDGSSDGCIMPEVADSLSNPEELKAFVHKQLGGPGLGSEAEAEADLKGGDTLQAIAEIRDKAYSMGIASDSWDEEMFARLLDDSLEEELFSSDDEGEVAQQGAADNANNGSPYKGHFILCGASRSVLPFMEHLRAAEPSRDVPIVVLSIHPPEDLALANERYGPVYYVKGSAAESASLRAAGAASAKALVYLARSSRPVKTAQATGSALQQERSTREAVLADADALLACYGVGEESGTELTHTVVELLFTTSIEFLQPGLLLKGVSVMYDESKVPSGLPRKSWQMRAWQQREAVAEGLAEWQANPYFAAGRVTVPALMDTFATQCFFNKGMLVDLLAEFSGDFRDSNTGHRASRGAMLQQIPLPRGLWGKTYGDAFMTLAVTRNLISLGLYRRKSENILSRLHYVVTNPPWDEVLEPSDRVFVVRPR